MPRRIRIGIDTGGTFTDVVAVDEQTGEIVTTKTPSTPDDPADGFVAAVEKVLDRLGIGADALTAVSHGTTVATNALLQGRVGNLGLITTDGYRHILEVARQSVPDGYGNSYFWVKPERIVPADLVRTVGGRLAVDGGEIRPFDENDTVAVARFFRSNGSEIEARVRQRPLWCHGERHRHDVDAPMSFSLRVVIVVWML